MMRKTLKWICRIILATVLLFITLTILLYVPPVQDWVVRKVVVYASEQTGMNISVKRVRLVFPLDLGIDGFCMIQQNDSLPQVKDTIADVRRLIADVRLWPLLKKQVEIKTLEFNNLKLNTADFIHEARIKGNVGRLYMNGRGIDLKKETVNIKEAMLRDAIVDVELSDTVPPDTSKSENRWKIYVSRLGVVSSGVTVHFPGDTLQVETYMGKTEAVDGYFDLYKGLYKIRSLTWTEGKLKYDNNFKVSAKGLDFNHIHISDINIGIDSLSYCSPNLDMSLKTCSFREKSGLAIDKISGKIALDSSKVSIPSFSLRTPNSSVSAHLMMNLDAFSDKAPGKIHLTADASFGKQDIMLFLGGMPQSFIRQWPNQPLTVKSVCTGNLKHLKLAGLNVKLPTAFNMNASGYATNADDTDKLYADVKLDTRIYNLGFVQTLVSNNAVNTGLRIPYGIGIKGGFHIEGKRYMANITVNENGGKAKARAEMNVSSKSYRASLETEGLHLGHFLPGSNIGILTGRFTAKGKGFDIMSPLTSLQASADVCKFSYDKYNLDDISLNADISKGKAHAGIHSDNRLINGSALIDALIGRKEIRSTFTLNLKHADLYKLHIVKSPLTTSLSSRIDFFTDMKTVLSVDGNLSNIEVVDSGRIFRPDDMNICLFSSSDTTHLSAKCGDFRLLFNSNGGYKQIMEQSLSFKDELVNELKNKNLSLTELRKKLPHADLYLNTGKENPFSRFIARSGYVFQDADIDLSSSPFTGLNGSVQLLSLQNNGIKLDTIRLNIVSDSAQCKYYAQVRNNRNNSQYVFNAMLDGYMFAKGSGANIKFYDARDSLGLKLGIEASMEEQGIKIHMLTDDPVLGYKKFKVNEDNFMFLGTDRRISASLLLQSDDKMAVHIYTDDDNKEALQDLTIALNKFDLEKILSVIPYMPRMTGIMNGDFHLIQTQEELSVSSALSVDSMTYENSRMGNIATEFVYMPKSDGTHRVDGTLMCDGKQVADINGSYSSEGDGHLDAKLEMMRLPVRLLNGFMPDRIVRFRGYADGSLDVKGSLSKIQADGGLTLDSCYMRSPQYGMNMRMSEGPIRIVGSNILFEDFKMYAANNNPFGINGNIDFSDPANMNMNLRMQAKNCQIINSKENRRSVAFGKAFVDFYATITGSPDNLKMLGRIDVLGSTDVSYILRDSPLSTDNRMDELVKFVNFSDTASTVVTHQPLSGFNMDLTVNISQGAHVICYLNTDHSNYVDLVGGGNLRMKYDAVNDLRLTGKYTLDNGEMKYSLPVIPLKTFTIRDGSYIEFTGDPMDPRLNVTATERTKANISSGSGQDRTVEFDCGVVITKTLSDMGLEFIIDTPEDMTLHNELQAMSVEQRGKLAVTMLTTGMYIADGNTGGFSMNDALSSFLQSEINNITGSALRTLDLSFGMDNSQDASGNTRTDYSFKFAKRFWNNRLRIVVGGKVSTGAEVENQNESFFDNVTFEYRLGNSTDKYVKLFYDNNAYDWLEGTTREYGVGFIWRRSLQHFKDIFNFKKKTTDAPSIRDTIKNNKQ